jgi:hypothetical protein
MNVSKDCSVGTGYIELIYLVNAIALWTWKISPIF